MSRAGILHVAVAHLDRLPLPDGGDWLHASERARLARLNAPSRRAQYLAGHWLARRLLAEAHGGAPRDWQLQEQPDRAPRVMAPPAAQTPGSVPVRLGLAHSGDWIAAAVGRERFGIDLEQRGRRLPRASFEPLLRNHDEPAGSLDDDALLSRWVAKEAWIKRDQGSALPARLREIQLVADGDGDGEIRAYGDTHLLLAVACPPACQLLGVQGLQAVGSWRVSELAPA